MYEYKVVTLKDRFLGGKFDPLRLEEALNAYGNEGWHVVGSATNSYGVSKGRDEMVFVMERQRA